MSKLILSACVIIAILLLLYYVPGSGTPPAALPRTYAGGIEACRQMYLLCGTVHNAPADTEIARIDVRYAEGPTEQFAIVYGRDVRNWWFDPQQPDPRMVWDGAIIGPESAGKRVRLYEMRWDNPRPDARIESLDFVSTLSPAAPFLIAITLQ